MIDLKEKTLREFLNAAVVPLIEDVLVKKLGQAMSYAKEQYTAPPKREWVSLTDEEIMDVWPRDTRLEFVRIIEAKLKEKNKW